MIDIVSRELNLVVRKYRKLTGFEGPISILSHSLGTVISWDILSHQMPADRTEYTDGTTSAKIDSKISHPVDPNCLNGPNTNHQYPKLEFEVVNNFMIGSPVAVFLMMRNQHDALTEDIQLPGCRRVFNIFHPYDPVAYRIEPLIHRSNAGVEATIIPSWKGGLRVQYQTKLLWRKLINETRKTKKNVVKAVEAGIEGIGLLDESIDNMEDGDDAASWLSEDSGDQTVHVGILCEGQRLDYMLQEKELEHANEYIAALAAHSSYWGEKDLSLFIARQILLGDRKVRDQSE